MPRFIAAFSVAFLLLAAVIVLSRITYNNTQKHAAIAERSRNVIKLYEAIDIELRSAEIFNPSYKTLAAGDLYKLYKSDADSIYSNLNDLRSLVQSDKQQLAVVDSLDKLVHLRLQPRQAITDLLESDEIERFGNLSAAYRLIRKGLLLEDQLLSVNKKRLNDANNLNGLFTWVLSALAVVVIIATFLSQTYLSKKTTRLEGFLESVLNTSQNGILHYRAVWSKHKVVDFKLAFANKASSELLNADPQLLVGRRWSEIDAFKHSSLFDACVSVVKDQHQTDLEYISKQDGKERSFALSIAKLNSGVTISFYENTAIKQTAADLKENIEALQQTNSELEEYAYAASHDLQEPLRKIRTFGAFLKETQSQNLDEKGRQQLEKILSSTERMTMLIKDLLSYSGLKTKEVSFEPTDLNEILEAVLDDLDLMITQQHAIITHERLPEVLVIPVQMNQLFYNLVNNSLKFARPGLPLHLDISCKQIMGNDVIDVAGLKPDHSYYEIVFSDNGIGFSQQYARQIFELFKRLHDKARYAGSGIGLSLCKKVVANHGGVMEANGKEGVGAQFYIYLPADQMPTTASEITVE